jgi:NAD(P)-dependent dehydrogenase (short-subunit alcohol dehydrogenase family)
VNQHLAISAGNTAVITGAASGIGLAAARVVAGFGMAVAMIDVPGEKLEEAAASLRGTGATVKPIGADVADAAAMKEAAARTARDLPPVTFLMNNAGIGPASSTLEESESWARIMDVNFWGVVHGTQAFGAAMIAHGKAGAIVNTGSKQGITTPPGNPAYNVSKSAVKSYTEALAHELRNKPDCTVSAHLMIPGWVFTGLTAASGGPKPDGAWTPEQSVDFMLQSLARGDFYILCPDNDVTRALDEKRIAWAAGDIIANRPALSRWHPDYAEAFKAFLAEDR